MTDEWTPMWHHAPASAREQIEREGLRPGQGGGYGSGESPLAYPKAVYLTAHPGLIGIPGSPGEEGAGGASGGDLWEVDTRGLPLKPDWPAVVEHGAYTGEGAPGTFYFQEGHSPETDALHNEWGEDLDMDTFNYDPYPMMNLTGTAAHHGVIPPERLKRISLEDWQSRYGKTASDDLKDLLDPGKDNTPYEGPITYLWVFDPQTDEVHLEHNDDKEDAYAVSHEDVARHVTHPSRVEGYAYKIRGGWRITTADHRPEDDPHIAEKVRVTLKHANRRYEHA